MTSLSKKNAHSDVLRKSSESLEAETIEVIPELPFQGDSDDDYSEFSDDVNDKQPTNVDEDEPSFDEYAYQVSSNHHHSESHPIWFDDMNNSPQLRSMQLMNGSKKDPDIILIDDDDERHTINKTNLNNQFNQKKWSNRLTNHNNQYEHKYHVCKICNNKLSSSYNLKRHMMIHSGEKPFECSTCSRRFREQSDLRKHRKVHDSDLILKCSICHKNPISNRNTMKCNNCEKPETVQKSKINLIEMDAIVPRIDGKNRKSFVCNYCDRAFGSSSNLKRHIMVHTGEKPFSCSECNRPFREMSTLKKHLITHRREHGFSKNPSLKDRNQSKQTPESDQSAKVQIESSLVNLHKCPLCMTICRGTDGLMGHIMLAHRTDISNEKPAKEIVTRKLPKSPPPLIPINRANFNYSNIKRI